VDVVVRSTAWASSARAGVMLVAGAKKVQVRSSVLKDRIIAARCSLARAFEEVITTRKS
jgi:hypothetical protein